MPRYDYLCNVCGITFEAIAPSDCNELPCTTCNTALIIPLNVPLAKRQLSYPASIHIN